jgi:queuine tRNA-ribosyltransferase
MPSPLFSFVVNHVDRDTNARRSTFTTPRGDVQMPAFMPVGTQGTVKGVEIGVLRESGAEMMLANTYHLALRPGEDVVAELDGLQAFTGWDGPILTDSGGFQIFSLANISKVNEEGARFRSHIDGRLLELSPERALEVQQKLGSTVAMVLDHVVALPNEEAVIRDACDRTIRWAERTAAVANDPQQAVFSIVQGGLDPQLRVDCAEKLAAIGFDGYAIGGLSVGEAPVDMYRTLDATCPALPEDRPRYLMGVGRPQDLLEAVRRGVDLFDCVIPTRNGRNSLAFTDEGPLRMRNLKHHRDTQPLEADCPCPACRRSRGYIRHLFQAGEMLGPILLTIHNLTYYQRLLRGAREAIEADRFQAFFEEKMRGWGVEPAA